jgi:hypothetical protein
MPVIFIGMGTCGLAAGAQKVEEAIRAELAKNNITGTYRNNRLYRLLCQGSNRRY